MAGRWLYPGPRDGLLIEEARGWRFECRDGALVEHRPGEEPRVLAGAGEVTGLTIVDGTRMPRATLIAGRVGPTDHDQALVVHAHGRPVVAVPVLRLAHQSTSDASEGRAAAGLARFAQGFGLPLERDEGSEPRPAALFHVGPVDQRLRREARVHLAVIALHAALWVLYGVLVARDGAFADQHPVPLVVQSVLLVGLTIDLVRRRRRFAALVGRPPEPGSRSVVGGPGPWQLQVGPDDVVLHGGAHEQWVPGPGRGGVDRCFLHDDALVFARRDAPALFVPRTMVDDDSVRRACRSAGIDVDRRRGPGLDSQTRDRVSLERRGQVLSLSGFGGASGNGSFVTPLVVSVGALLLAGSGLDPERRELVPSLALAVVGLGVYGTNVWLWWTRRRWIASIRTGG